ncbi:SDR family oxidoreductase [Caldinitratiruptor microaerophilus]|uniref:3-oxoacyl-[acyl-carrier-protein] reductase FabG n=1 Tax=Caldinitratiruptor microaerophilus TaxID=671077 RepID=A0AA35G7H7_9FIRM|nr:SDR family NAD(P)-dependent oxidoreductase [Caldinitratiruptor microaerophilus]BDG60111.1 3-oxoacyl-[acyl-carrier-protein] reductase FabG [Caldinitratiruptor microaerophilus]
MNLKGKVVLVTGAGRGIGRATAVAMAREGATVVAADLDLETAWATASECTAQGPAALGIYIDVGNPVAVAAAVDETVRAYGRIDVLVNNAGIGGTGTRLADMSLEEWQRMIHIDLTGVFLVCRAVVPLMIRQGRGNIINLASTVGLSGLAGSTHYGAAKAGVIGLTKCLAKELAGHRINVNAVAPGLIDTEMSRRRGTVQQPGWVLWPRVGQPEDVAAVICFLASDAAEFITGQVISPNGGGWM